MTSKSLPLSLPYFIAIAIDAIGFTIIGPVLVPLTNHLVVSSGLTQHLLYGFILSIYSLSFMFGAPILGALSDLLGRRKVLIISSFGVLSGYLCYAISLSITSLSFLILGRIITGFCAASQCIAQAAMVDLSQSQNQNRVNNIGLIASAMTAGLVIGPLVSLLSGENLSIDAFKIPFYSIITILILNLLYLIFFLKESYETQSLAKEVSIIKKQIQQFFQQFTSRNTRNVFIIFFLFELGWSLYYQSLAIELPLNLQLNPKSLAIFLSFLGISLTASLLFLVRIVFRSFKLLSVFSPALFFGVIILILQFFFNGLHEHYIFGLIITGIVGLVYSGLIAQLSQQTKEQNQGLLMGTSDALLALAYTLTGLLAGALAYYLPGLTSLTAAGFWLLALLITTLNDRSQLR